MNTYTYTHTHTHTHTVTHLHVALTTILFVFLEESSLLQVLFTLWGSLQQKRPSHLFESADEDRVNTNITQSTKRGLTERRRYRVRE